MSDGRELDLNVDPERLYEQWQTQPGLMLQYGVALADAKRDYNAAKRRVAVAAARAAQAIRKDPAAYNIQRVTDAAVATAVTIHPKHSEAIDEMEEARHQMNVLDAVVAALGDRRTTLKGFTELWLRMWHGDPMSTGGTPTMDRPAERASQHEKEDAELRETVKQRRRKRRGRTTD